MLNKTDLEVLGYRFKVTRRQFTVCREVQVSKEYKQAAVRAFAFDAQHQTYTFGQLHYIPPYKVFTGTRPQIYGGTRGRSWPAPNDKEMWKQMIDAANLDFVKQRVTA